MKRNVLQMGFHGMFDLEMKRFLIGKADVDYEQRLVDFRFVLGSREI